MGFETMNREEPQPQPPNSAAGYIQMLKKSADTIDDQMSIASEINYNQENLATETEEEGNSLAAQ